MLWNKNTTSTQLSITVTSATNRSQLSKPISAPASAKSATSPSAKPKTNFTIGSRLYLAGPIRGVPDFAARFSRAAIHLRHAGYKVFNPVEQDDLLGRHGMPVGIRTCLELDLAWICRYADIVVLLPGWRQSAGAMAEYYTAIAIGIDTWELPDEYL